MRAGVGTTTSVWGGRADPAASRAAAPFTGMLGSFLLGCWAGLHRVPLGLGALPLRGGHDATVGNTGSSGRRAGDRVGWGQAAAVQGGREPIQAALWRAQSWKPRRYSHGPGLDVAPGSYFPSQNLGV